MPYTNKLDVNVVSFIVSPGSPPTIVYSSFPGTFNLDLILGYNQFADPITGAATNYTIIYLSGGPAPVIIDMTYTALDAIINP